MNNGDPRFPYSRYLKVPFVFVPDGNPPPLEWMRENPNYVTVRGVFIPDPPREPNMGLEPQTRAEGQLELLQDVGTYEVVIDYAGNFIARPVPPLTPQPAPWTEPQPEAEGQAEPPEEPTYEEQEPEVELEPPQRPDDLRSVAPPGPRRARGEPPPLGPTPAARGMDPLSPEFTGDLMRQTKRAVDGMDRVMRPGGIATPEGLSAAVRAGMQHLATHKGDIAAGLASLKAAGAAGHKSEPTPPTPWTHRISKAEADRLFVAACHAAVREAEQSPAFHARTDQRIEAVDVAKIAGASNDRPEIVPVTMAESQAPNGKSQATVAAMKAARAAKSVGEPKPSKPSPLLELAESTMNPRYAARMLGYDLNTFGDMIHAFKDFYRLRPDNNVRFYDNGDVFFQGQYVGNIHEFGP
jgi:hypothetical protein